MAIWSNGDRLPFVLALLTISYVIGIFVFTQGFLLNRLVIPKQSSCEDGLQTNSSLFSHEQNIGSCWMPARFRKAVIIVIDALRHDFMLYNESLADQDTENYQNKLRVVHEVLKTNPEHGKVFKFVADPPTTTMQRIKGLTTGSLPTFIDAGSNFASTEILEDNMILQLKNLGKNLVFMGDDTWMGLFPNSFKRHYPFPSFNVKDLHTVDNGVISHLLPEIRKHDWDIVIAHFLGVDHCGHRYGPYHLAMAEKLVQMDEVLRSVINELDNETVLLVFGDHGMTKTGDHGGDSPDEVFAGLFVYSLTKLFPRHQLDEEDLVVFQTDIVPTISLLLGSAIPFANLGIVMTSLFEETAPRGDGAEEKKQLSLQALQLNARQVHRYLMEYSRLSNDVSSSALKNLTNVFLEAERQVSKKDVSFEESVDIFRNTSLLAAKGYLAYLRGVRELCRSVWAKFDLVLITAGVSLISLSCLASIVAITFANTSPNQSLVSQLGKCYIFASLLIVFLCGFLLCYGYTRVFFAIVFLASGIVLFLTKIAAFSLSDVVGLSCNLRTSAVMLVLCCYFLGFFSNSFVVHEDKGVLFFLQTVLLIGCFDMFRNASSKFSELNNPRPVSRKFQRREDKKWTTVNLSGVLFKLMLFVVLLIQNRLCEVFWFCREEQAQCQTSSFAKPANTLRGNKSQPGYQFWLSHALLCLVPAFVVIWLKSCGNLNGYSCTVLSTKYALPLGGFFVCLHWFLQFVPSVMLEQTPILGTLQQIITPCLVYACCALTLLCLICNPLTIYYAGTRDVSGEPTNTRRNRPAVNSVVEIFNRLRSEMNEPDSEKDEKLPVVYGLGTVYSAAITILLACFAIPLAMLMGGDLASSVTLMLTQLYGFLELCSLLTVREAVEDETTGSLVYPVITWLLMSSHYFFSSGHQATIPAIRFEAAFVGLPGDMENVYLPGFLILLNTFVSDVIFGASLPLILFWSKKAVAHKKKTVDVDEFNKEEFVYAEHPDRLRSETFRVCALYQVCKGFKLLGTMLAATLHRRHLMVWKIFAPRFIFEGVSFIITSLVLISVFCFILRVDSSLKRWRRLVLEKAQEHEGQDR